jgi:hypothetical protein
VIVAESPPASGKYFYKPEGLPSEPLFAALMRQLPFSPRTKQEGLTAFQRRDWVLVDATYEPVNKNSDTKRNMTISKRNKVIDGDYQELRSDLESLMPDRSTPLILIKANVCRLLKPKLAADRFNVLNSDCVVPFPSTGHQTEFYRQFGAIVKSAGL